MEKLWVKNYPPGVVEVINPEDFSSIAAAFKFYTKKYQDCTAFTNFGTELTYQQLAELSAHFAAYLQQELQLKKGDRVAIMLPNLLQYPIVLYAILQAGLVAVNINPLYTVREVNYQLTHSEAKAIIVLANFADVVVKALPSHTQHVIVTQIGDALGWLKGRLMNWGAKYLKHLVPSVEYQNLHDFSTVLAKGRELVLNPVEIFPTDLAFLQYTSGTTGKPKGVMLTHRNLLANMAQCHAWVQPLLREREEVILAALPLYHIYSLTVCCLTFATLGGNCLLITDPRNLDHMISSMQKLPVSVFVGINTLFVHLLAHPRISEIDFQSLKMTLAGGMATQPTVAKKWQEVTGSVLLEGYGLSEASPVVTINPFNVTQFKGSIGLPVPSTEIKICDDKGKELDCNEPGELWIKGPQVMKGYWNDDKATQEVLTSDGWLRTGDVVKIDEEGYLYVMDRLKDIILVSGFNVNPSEVENVIAELPEVAEVAVVGVPDANTGEAVKAVVVKHNPELTSEKILAHCHQFLTQYKIPKHILFKEQLPKSNIGKILKRELREY